MSRQNSISNNQLNILIMHKRNFSTLILVSALLFSINICAQERTIIGITTVCDSIPVAGATVKVQSTGQEVLSDSLGNFSVTCKAKDKLKVSAMGFYDENAKLNDRTKLVAVNLRLKPGEENIEHAIGYGHISDKDKLFAVSSLNKNDVDFSKYKDMPALIRGRLTGVQVYDNRLVIRGMSSTASGVEPLILIDGIQSNYATLKMLFPVQVKNISVLKDASASIYGTRAANGVIIIETKR